MQHLCLDDDLTLNGKSTDNALFCLYEDISFICVTYLFDLGIVLKCIFSFVIYIIFKLCYLAEAFIFGSNPV